MDQIHLYQAELGTILSEAALEPGSVEAVTDYRFTDHDAGETVECVAFKVRTFDQAAKLLFATGAVWHHFYGDTDNMHEVGLRGACYIADGRGGWHLILPGIWFASMTSEEGR